MAPSKKPLPSDFVVHPTNSKRIQCLPCSTDNANPYYILRTSMSSHKQCIEHQHAQDRALRRLQEKELNAKQFEQTYNGFTLPPDSAFSFTPSVLRPNLPDASDLPAPPPIEYDQLPEFHWTSDQIPGLLDPGGAVLGDDEETRLAGQFKMLMMHAQHIDEFGYDSDDESDELSAQYAELDEQNTPSTDEALANHVDAYSTTGEYSPYASKTTMLLDIIDNLPRLRLSSGHLRLHLWLLRELGVRDVPSYDKFRATQKKLKDLCGSTPKPVTSTFGNHFHVIDIRETVARDLSNPEVAKHLQFYPEDSGGKVSEVWQAGRWKEFPPNQLTPMFSRGMRQFYIDELARMTNGTYIIPVAWIYYGGKLCADVHVVEMFVDGWDLQPHTVRVQTDDIESNYFDVVSQLGLVSLPWKPECRIPAMPNSLRNLAGDEDLYVVFISAWGDDVSGNKTKQYNKHLNVYTSNGCLPGRLLQQEFFVKFYSTSPVATSHEQFSAFRDQINATHTNPVRCYNASTHRHCRVILRTPSLPADNPQQSEEASHIGSNGSHPCRRCKVGGDTKYKESDVGYESFYTSGILRNRTEIVEELNSQIRCATQGVKKDVEAMQTESGTKDKFAEHWISILLEKAAQFKSNNSGASFEDAVNELSDWYMKQPGDKINPLLDIPGLDPSQDTPVEILHTILLGIIKYVWHMLHTSWTDAQINLFAIRLQSTNIDGLSIPVLQAAYMAQYRNNLIGKHFKSLTQTMPFHVHGIATPAQFALIKAVGRLSALLWVHEIPDMDKYLTEIEILVANVLDSFADNDPAKMILKIKIHLLTHLCVDIRRFGPAIRSSTEVYEAFNAVFRLCSILSNHQAPSRDIATKFCAMDRMTHILCGGYWEDPETHTWRQANSSVLRLIENQPILQRHLGWTPVTPTIAGHVRLQPAKAKNSLAPAFWRETRAFVAYSSTPGADVLPPDTLWKHGISVRSLANDTCKIGSWIFGEDFMTKRPVCGRVTEILVASDTDMLPLPSSLVSLDIFEIGRERHPDFDCPVLRRPARGARTHAIIACDKVSFLFNAQHDCRMLGCQPTALRARRQERELTDIMDKLLEHADSSSYVINMFGFHNAILLRQALPEQLVSATRYVADRKSFHRTLAAKLRATQSEKRARTAEKSAKTRARNKALKEARLTALSAEAARRDLDRQEEEDQDGADLESDPEETEGPSRKRRRE